MADISKIKLPNNAEYNLKDPISYNKVISRGEQLIVNGSGTLGDNTNWSNWTFDGVHANSSAGSFTRASTACADITTDEYFPVNAGEKYKFEFDLISQNNAGTMYAYLSFYDVDKIPISASTTMYYSGTLTTLARELKAGDTKVYLTDASEYRTYGTASHLRALIFWDYKNSFNYQYPPETYSRNILMPAWANDSSIDKTNNIITLETAYTGITHPAGTYVSQGCSGRIYKYSGITGQKVPTEWTHYTGYFDGTDYSGLNLNGMFPPATAYCKVGFLWDYNSANDYFWLTNTSVKEVPKEAVYSDNAGKVNNHTVNADVPTNAKFTDTTYTGTSPISINSSNQVSIATASTSAYGATKLNSATNSTSTTESATPSAVKTAYDLANSANTTAGQALSGVNGALIYDHTYTISNGVAVFTPHVYQKGAEVTSNYSASCFTWKYRLIDGSEVTLSTDSTTRGCSVTISNMGYGGHVIGTFTPA